jgi:PAS domain S-box-containing protein
MGETAVTLHQQQKKALGRPLLWGLITFLLAGAICALLVYLEFRVRRNESERQLYSVAETVRSRLQQSLQYSLSATQTMALTINRDGVPVNFDSVARYVLSYNKFIDALQLAPKGVIQYVYPLEPHKAVVGYDVLSDPLRRTEALIALERKELFFAGPFELRQGGLGVVGRLPVFLNDEFWGFSAVVIRLNTLLEAAGIDSSGASGYYFQLSKINPDTGEEEFFLPLHSGHANAYSIAVTVPDGEWKLSVLPAAQVSPFQSTILLGSLGFLLSVIAGLFAYNRSKAPTRLQQLVDERTLELDQSERRHKAIVNALPDMLLVIDGNNCFVDYNNPMGNPTLLPPEEFLGKHVSEVLPPDLAEETLANKETVLREQRLLTHSYYLSQNGPKKYFEARYAPQGKTDVLILVRDITETALAEQRIRDSEAKYRTLVEQANDAIFIANLKGELIVVNPAGSRISQYSQEELLQMRIHELTVQEQLEAMPFKFQELATGAAVTSERKLTRKDGSVVDVEITAKMIAADRFLAFVRDISERKRVEKELLQSREDLRRLSNYIEQVREQERLHISREIHDELGQHLTVLKMDVSRLAKKIQQNDPGWTGDFQEILDAINDMVIVVRRISTELRPGLLDDLGLIAAIDWYGQDFEKRTGIKTSMICSVQEEELPREFNIGIFRIFQESLTNVARHAGADKVDISLVRQGNQLVLLIEDNGRGFEHEEIQHKKTLGIMGMKERAIMMGGSYTIQSANGKGTVVEVVIPLERADSAIS